MKGSSERFWAAVVVLTLAAGAGGWAFNRPDANPTATPDPALQTVESLPLQNVADDIVADTLAPGDPRSVAPPQDAVGTTEPPSGTAPVCTSQFGWTIAVPAGWYESDCQLFAPWPITSTDPTTSNAPVQVVYLDGVWDDVIVAATPEDRQVIGQGDATVAGRRAFAVTSVQIEPGWFDAGTAVYEIWVDDGGRVVIVTAWAADGDLSWLAPVVDELAASLAL